MLTQCVNTYLLFHQTYKILFMTFDDPSTPVHINLSDFTVESIPRNFKFHDFSLNFRMLNSLERCYFDDFIVFVDEIKLIDQSSLGSCHQFFYGIQICNVFLAITFDNIRKCKSYWHCT